MAEGRTYRCDQCPNAVEAWSDGNPYYMENGRKCHAYHPNHEALARCIGNDSPYLCLACGESFKVDSNAPRTACLKCASAEIVPTWLLEGRSCPKCRTGHFRNDPHSWAVS